MGKTKVFLDTNILISGDPHLLKLREFAKVKIITVSEFLGF